MRLSHFRTESARPSELDAIRSLMGRAFGGDFTDEDWEHSIGGWHVVAGEDEKIVAHASLVERSIEVGGRAFDTGYVEAVAIEPTRQGLGFGTAVMEVVGELIATHHELGALSTGEHHFYERLGWKRWRGATYVRDGDQTIRTAEEDDGIMVLRVGPSIGIDLEAPISCEPRRGDDW